MSNTGPFDALITEWQRPLQMTAHALAEKRNFKNLRPEEKGRANGVINALVNAGMNKLDIARLLGIEGLGKVKRPFQLQELPAKGRMIDEQIETHRLRMGLRAAASEDRRTSRIVPAEEARKRRPDVIDVRKQQSTFAFVKSSDPGDPLKLDVVPIEALPAAIEAARGWIKDLAIGGPDNDPYQNILWATAERFDTSVEEAQELLLRRLDYWTANLPGQEAQRPSRIEFPSIAASIDDLPMPTRDMRLAANASAKKISIHHHGRSHYTPVIPGSKEALSFGRGRKSSPTHGTYDEPTRVKKDHIAALEVLLADEGKLKKLRADFARKKSASLHQWVKENLQIMKPGFDSTKYGFPITRAPLHDDWFMFYASLQERDTSCSFNCHAKEVCYGGSSGMTKRFNPDARFQRAFELELKILARITKPEVRVMDMGDVPDGEFARMLVDTVTDPAIKDRALLWIVTAKHSGANPDLWMNYFDGYSEEERKRDMEVGNILLAASIRHPKQIRLQFSTMFKNIPASMRFSGDETVPATSYALTAAGNTEKSAAHCVMHSPKLAVDARDVFNLATGDTMERSVLDTLRHGVGIKCSTCQACPIESADPFTGIAIDLSGHGGKIHITVNRHKGRIDTSRGGSRELGTREVTWETGETVTLSKAERVREEGTQGGKPWKFAL